MSLGVPTITDVGVLPASTDYAVYAADINSQNAHSQHSAATSQLTGHMQPTMTPKLVIG